MYKQISNEFLFRRFTRIHHVKDIRMGGCKLKNLIRVKPINLGEDRKGKNEEN